MFGAMNFLPIFQQYVQGASATGSGLLLLPLMFGMLIVSILSGRAITRTGRYRIFPIIGGVLMTVGMLLLTLLDAQTSRFELGAYLVVLGAGMGFLMQTSMLIAQNSVEQRDLGAASGAATFFRSIGGSFGVSLFGAVFATRFQSELTDKLGAQAAEQFGSGGGGAGTFDPAVLAGLPAAARNGLLTSLADSIAGVFWWAVAFSVLVPVLAWFVKEIPLRGAPETSSTATPEEQAERALADAPAVP
jgi:hypothetical protein